jgi:hypothetical protein
MPNWTFKIGSEFATLSVIKKLKKKKIWEWVI